MLLEPTVGLMSLFFAWVHHVWHKEWWELFNKADSKRFPELMGVFVLLAMCVMLNSTYQSYLRSWLYMDMREFSSNNNNMNTAAAATTNHTYNINNNNNNNRSNNMTQQQH
ncbi:unnamed protein product [Polarella glacialis]|uniref:Uncharacterized protein n=1 Tax=Polarella glacialis TaxID=89957 RepID=A0A813HXM7_POLGL|nr:unnamed protein product [Polarella glacialis]